MGGHYRAGRRESAHGDVADTLAQSYLGGRVGSGGANTAT